LFDLRIILCVGLTWKKSSSRTLLIPERFLATCSKSVEVFLKERAIKDLDELGKLAEQHEDAHRASFTASKGNKSNSPNKSPRRHNKSFNRTGQNKVKCFICGKSGHIARNCFQTKAQVNEIAAPLTDLTKKGSPNKIVWTETHEQAFQALKGHVCTQAVLCLPDVNKPFIL